MHAHKALIRVVKCHVGGHAVLGAVILAHDEVQRGVRMHPLIKPAVVGVQLKDLLVCPSKVLGLVSLVNEIRGQVGARIDGVSYGVFSIDPGRESQVLELASRHPAPVSEQPRPDHAT